MGIFDAIWKRRGRPNHDELDEAEEEPTYTIRQTTLTRGLEWTKKENIMNGYRH